MVTEANPIDEVIATLIKERDDWGRKCMELNRYCEAVENGINTYKKVLREWMESDKDFHSKLYNKESTVDDLADASQRSYNAKAAAEKLLNPKGDK